eukprot:Blabericola_migrator_1__13523@NODE_988_length_5794_cov_180_252314_g681_i0_p1_GENE_NODE_988_length_5794_cov_180_252314_g681_i0NODE_988_length_5794_cov_180_252314_g681_i0_p1_ORF_typecomplete_len559_score75_25IstB_IS21/PF01695_17/1_5e05NBARC/PF00931_22/4_9e05AAA_16/PF13191_6/8_9e05Bac_DnaA/PF00308_18/0_00019AAA_25/PF13481_6/0_00028T2SSE/PF00437_20/0_00096ABC_tran/PF00005_27/0_0011KAP_NTPase/PF07693_14/0_002NACHT/PF05729_12/0_0048AAA_7/PF12775_7/0_004AAA_30/PF13604_6/0_007AAA_22/PF13401_6/0_012PRK/P
MEERVWPVRYLVRSESSSLAGSTIDADVQVPLSHTCLQLVLSEHYEWILDTQGHGHFALRIQNVFENALRRRQGATAARVGIYVFSKSSAPESEGQSIYEPKATDSFEWLTAKHRAGRLHVLSKEFVMRGPAICALRFSEPSLEVERRLMLLHMMQDHIKGFVVAELEKKQSCLMEDSCINKICMGDFELPEWLQSIVGVSSLTGSLIPMESRPEIKTRCFLDWRNCAIDLSILITAFDTDDLPFIHCDATASSCLCRRKTGFELPSALPQSDLPLFILQQGFRHTSIDIENGAVPLWSLNGYYVLRHIDVTSDFWLSYHDEIINQLCVDSKAIPHILLLTRSDEDILLESSRGTLIESLTRPHVMRPQSVVKENPQEPEQPGHPWSDILKDESADASNFSNVAFVLDYLRAQHVCSPVEGVDGFRIVVSVPASRVCNVFTSRFRPLWTVQSQRKSSKASVRMVAGSSEFAIPMHPEKTLDLRPQVTTAWRCISQWLTQPRVVGIVGGRGCGKTTLLAYIAQQMSRDAKGISVLWLHMHAYFGAEVGSLQVRGDLVGV